MNQSNQANRFAVATAAIAVATIVTGVVALIAPGAVAPGVAAVTTAAIESEPFVYFPAQYVNQAKENGPEYPTF